MQIQQAQIMKGLIHHYEGTGFYLLSNGVKSFKQRRDANVFAIRRIPMAAENEGKQITIVIQA